jgi:SM-20-related protein
MAGQVDMNQMSGVELLDNDELELLWDKMADALVDPGYIVLDSVLIPEVVQALALHLDSIEQGMASAGVGRGQDFHQNQHIRGDRIRWLSDQSPVEKTFLDWMEKCRIGLNQRLYLGLMDYECHFAVYPAGSCYQKHLDVFRDSSESNRPVRKISTVFYLNQDWKPEDGGALVLYDETGQIILESIAPECGRMLVFLSEKFPHEVNVAHQKRRSIAGWIRSR